MTTEQSDAYTLVALVYAKSWKTGGQSWRRLNAGLNTAVLLAISTGIEFGEDDFAQIYRDFQGGYWFTGVTGGEHFYRAAIEHNHSTAIASFEKWKGRRPMIVKGDRLWQGQHFVWDGQEVIVTSFNDAEQSVIACAYQQIRRYSDGHYGQGKPTKRYTINWADLAPIRKR